MRNKEKIFCKGWIYYKEKSNSLNIFFLCQVCNSMPSLHVISPFPNHDLLFFLSIFPVFFKLNYCISNLYT